MTAADRRLLRGLASAVLVKLLLLAGLWWGFIRDARVQVDAEAAAAHVVAPPGRPSPPSGEKQ